MRRTAWSSRWDRRRARTGMGETPWGFSVCGGIGEWRGQHRLGRFPAGGVEPLGSAGGTDRYGRNAMGVLSMRWDRRVARAAPARRLAAGWPARAGPAAAWETRFRPGEPGRVMPTEAAVVRRAPRSPPRAA